jgi:hypothetical protein
VKLILANINPLKGFDLSKNRPRFSRGNEPPLNPTEKVGKVVMHQMRIGRNNPREESHDDQNCVELKREKHTPKAKVSKKLRENPRDLRQNAASKINNQAGDFALQRAASTRNFAIYRFDFRCFKDWLFRLPCVKPDSQIAPRRRRGHGVKSF